MTATEPIFTKVIFARLRAVKNSHTKFHENRANHLVTDNKFQTKEQ